MVSVLLRTAGGTALFVAFLWLVRIDDYRVAGMMLTFPMLNGMALVSAGANARQTGQSMVPIVTLNGVMCFLLALAFAWSDTARAHPLALTMLARCRVAVRLRRAGDAQCRRAVGCGDGCFHGGVRCRLGGDHHLAVAGLR